jgi:hypothetical protein
LYGRGRPDYRVSESQSGNSVYIGNIQKESSLKAVVELQGLNTTLSSKIIIIIIIGLFDISSP